MKNFRSFSRLAIDDVREFFAIAGRNGVGKSNILRALNLFFNDEVQPGLPLDLAADFHKPSRRTRKEIEVAVTFELPTRFRFHHSIADAARRAGLTANWFKLLRRWRQDPTTQFLLSEFELLNSRRHSAISPDLHDVTRVFLSRLVQFRYVPNHIHPLQVIDSERRRLQQALIAKVNKSKKLKGRVDPKRQLQIMGETAKSLIEPAVAEIRSTADELGMVNVGTPADWSDVVLSLDLEMSAFGDEARRADLHGSGHQALLALSLLHLIDTQYSTQFGWHQATIWGLEEPESFLHYELEMRVSELLREYAKARRFQVFATTHSPCVMASADAGVVVDKAGATTHEKADLIRSSFRSGASPFVHPLLAGMPKALLVVEGPTDRDHLDLARVILGVPDPWEVQPVCVFSDSGGDRAFPKVLKMHHEVIRSRPARSPIGFLLDHSVKPTQVQELDRQLRALHSRSFATQWRSADANPVLDAKSFRGVEAFLGTRALEAMEAVGNLELLRSKSNTILRVERSEIEQAKHGLVQLCRRRKRKNDYLFFAKPLSELDARLRR